MKKYIIITGNPVDGFEFIGPFDTNEEACEFGNMNGNLPDYADWNVAELHPKES